MRSARFLSLVTLSGSLTVGAAAPAFAQSAPAAQAQVAQGAISSLDAELNPRDQADAQGRHFRTRTVTLRANEGVEIAVSSEAFDTMVRVEGPNGQVVAENDDAPGEGLNSRVQFRSTVAGAYRVTVTSYNAGETGDFHMEITRGASVGANTAANTGANPGCDTGACPLPGVPNAPPAAVAPQMPTQGAYGYNPTDPQLGAYAGSMFVPAQQYVRGPNGQLIPYNDPTPIDPAQIAALPGGQVFANPGAYGAAPQAPGANGMFGYYAAPSMPGMYGQPGVYGQPGNFAQPGAVGQAPSFGQDPSFGQNDPSFDPNADPNADPNVDPNAQPPSGNNTATGNGNVYALIVGISDYGGANNLDYVADDARNLYSAMTQRGVLRAQNAIVLTDGQATPSAVQRAFQTMSQRVTDRDTFVFFFDGHGSNNQIVLRNGRMGAQEVSANLDRIRGQHLVVLDSCYSGSLASVVQGRANRVGLFSSTSSQVSYVASEFQSGGYLAWFLIQAVRQGVGGNDGLQVRELSQYVQQQYNQRVNGRQTLVVAGAQNLTLWGGAANSATASTGTVARR